MKLNLVQRQSSLKVYIS